MHHYNQINSCYWEKKINPNNYVQRDKEMERTKTDTTEG